MNTETDTPRTDEWETYCDECYYHLWRVRRKNERGFNDGYHVHNGDEARALVDLLNKQDSELAAVTEQRDRLAKDLTFIATDKIANAVDMRYRAQKALQSLTAQNAEVRHGAKDADLD